MEQFKTGTQSFIEYKIFLRYKSIKKDKNKFLSNCQKYARRKTPITRRRKQKTKPFSILYTYINLHGYKYENSQRVD